MILIFCILIFYIALSYMSERSSLLNSNRGDIWIFGKKLYLKAKEQYHPEEVSPFVYAHHVVCAVESENGEIFVGFCIEGCSRVMNLSIKKTNIKILIKAY